MTSFTVVNGSTDAAGNPIAPGFNIPVTPNANTNIDAFKTLSVDTLAPDAPVILSVIDDADPLKGTFTDFSSPVITNDRKPTLTISAEAGSIVSVYNGTRFIGSATQTDAPIVNNKAVFTFTPAYSLGEATYSFIAKAVDAAGNASVGSTAVDVLVDFTPPNRPTVDALITSNTSPTVTGTMQLLDGGSFSVSLNGGPEFTATRNGNNITYNPKSSPM